MRTRYNFNPAHKNTSVTITNLSLGVPPEQKSVDRHKKKEHLDKDLEDPCQKFDPSVGYLCLEKLRKTFGTHINNGHLNETTPIVRKVYSMLKHVMRYSALK